MTVILKNNAVSTLTTPISASDTGIVVASGAQFPTLAGGDYFYATLVSPAGTTEIVKVTARVGNSMTVVRAQDGSSAASFTAGSLVGMRVNAASIRELRDEASEVSIADTGGYYTATSVEGALAELAQDTLSRLDVSALLADVTLSYSNVTAGDVVRTRAEGFSYEVAASGASDHHLTTAGGAKLYVLPGDMGYNVKAFGAKASGLVADVSTNSTAFNAAITAASVSGGAVYVPAGTYYTLRVALASNVLLRGDGAGSILMQDESATGYPYVLGANIGSGGTTSTADNLRNITVRDIQFKRANRAAYASFADPIQFIYLVSVSAVSDALFERCYFTGFQGDGLYVGSSNVAGIERHNENVTVRDCVFDGVDRNNRNGISVIDCDGFLATGNHFKNCSSSFQPGAIDIEPNSDAFHIIRNIKITHNTFENNGGSNGSISVLLPDSAWTVQPTDFLIEGNTIIAGTADAEKGIMFAHFGDATTARNHNAKIVNNTVKDAIRGLDILGARNLLIQGNTLDRTKAAPIIGFTGSNKCMNIRVVGNRFYRLSNDNAQDGAGLAVFTVNHLDIHGNDFIDCGYENGTFGCCMTFSTGTSSHVSIVGNRFLDLNAKTTACIEKEADHTYTVETNQLLQNTFLNVGSVGFYAHENDFGWTAYSPVIAGTSTAGSGTYTRQYGRWRRLGKQVFFEVEIIQTAHTGTGMIQISLPTGALLSLNNELKAVAIALSGVSTTGGQIGLINPGAVVDGVSGAVWCYNSATGTLAQTIVPTGAAEYRVSGTYMAQ